MEGSRLYKSHDVLTRSSDDYRYLSCMFYVSDCFFCSRNELSQAEREVRLHHADQVMRHLGELIGSRLRGPDVHVSEHLATVGSDDLDWRVSANTKRQIGLTDPGGADYGEDSRPLI